MRRVSGPSTTDRVAGTPDALVPRDAAWSRWLTAPVDPRDVTIRTDLVGLLYGNRSSIIFAVTCLGIVILCHAAFIGYRTAIPLAALLAPAAALRYLTISRTWRGDSPRALLGAGLFWAASVGLVCGEGARTDDMLLTVLSGLVVVAISFGGAFNNAGAPRFAYIQTALFIVPYTIFTGLSEVPGMMIIPLQLPLWLLGIFRLIRGMHDTHAKLIRAQRLAHHLAFHDPLTGLPNRAQFLERLASECEAAARGNCTPSYVLYLDLDGFKPVNDTYGHATGDDLLCAVADRFHPLLRPGDLIGRLGGDEFGVILKGIDAAQAGRIGEKMIEATRQPFDLEGRPPIRIGVSIGGVALGLMPDMRHTLHAADTMLYAAKRAGKGMIRLADAI